MPNNVAIGVGTMEFPFSGAAAYWRWRVEARQQSRERDIGPIGLRNDRRDTPGLHYGVNEDVRPIARRERGTGRAGSPSR